MMEGRGRKVKTVYTEPPTGSNSGGSKLCVVEPRSHAQPRSQGFLSFRRGAREEGGKMRDPGNEVTRGGLPNLTARAY